MKMKIVFFVLATLILSPGGSLLANDGREESAVVETLDRMGQAMEHKDVAALAAVLHDDLTWGHSTGATQTKEQLVKEVGGVEIYELFKFSNFSMHIYGFDRGGPLHRGHPERRPSGETDASGSLQLPDRFGQGA